MPKALVTNREAIHLVDDNRQHEAHHFDLVAMTWSTEDNEITETKPLLSTFQDQPPHTNQMEKKKTSVKWKDLPNDVPDVSAAHCRELGNNVEDDGNDAAVRDKKQIATSRSPSPSSSLHTSLTLLELEQQIVKQESSIRRACQLELKLLNQCGRVRAKRSQMVQRLRTMQRKMQKLANADKWTAGKYLFPPEFKTNLSQTASMTDMTQSESLEVSKIPRRRLGLRRLSGCAARAGWV